MSTYRALASCYLSAGYPEAPASVTLQDELCGAIPKVTISISEDGDHCYGSLSLEQNAVLELALWAIRWLAKTQPWTPA